MVVDAGRAAVIGEDIAPEYVVETLSLTRDNLGIEDGVDAADRPQTLYSEGYNPS